MKKVLLILMVLPLVVFAQKTSDKKTSDKKFAIQASVTGLKDGSVVSLTDVNNPTDTVAKSIVKKGSFTLKGSVEEPNLYQLNFSGVQKKSMLFLSNDQITLTGDIGSVQDFQIKGSAVNDDFTKFQQTFNPLFKELTMMNQQIGARGGVGADDSLMVAYKKTLEKIQTSIDEFISTRKSSPISPFLLLVTSELDQDVAHLENRFQQIDPATQKSFYGKILQQQIADSKFGSVGSEALDFTQTDTAGKPVSLTSLRGKYVLLDFWASWCKPCRMENPNVVAAFNKFRDKNFTIVSVSLDRSRESWLQAIREDNLSWTQVSDLKFWSNEVAVKYRIQSIPQNFLIGPDGKIVGKNLRGPALESKLCELLGCN
jgi:peroxiredoxin